MAANLGARLRARDPEVLVPLALQLIVELRKRDGRIQDLEHRMDLLLRRIYGLTQTCRGTTKIIG